MKRELLRVNHLTKSFDNVSNLDDLSFSLYEGEILGLAGLNGSGKTALAEILNGVHQQDSGTIWLGDICVSISSPNVARKLGIYSIGQNLDLVPNLSIAENLAILSNQSQGFFINRKSDYYKAKLLLDELGLTFTPETKCGRLTLTQQRLIQVVKGLFIGCKILIIDNITNAYSANEQAEFLSLLKLVRDRGCGIIFVSQNTEQLFSVCDRVLALRKGYCAGQLFPEGYQKERLMSLLVGHTYDDLFSEHSAVIGETVFEVRNLHVKSLHDFSLLIHRGEIVGISDISNSGLADFLQLFSEGGRIEAGTILLNGKPLHQFSAASLLRNRIGFISKNSTGTELFPNLTVAENANFLLLSRMTNRVGILSSQLEKYAFGNLLQTLPFTEKALNTRVSELIISREQELMILLERWQKISPYVLVLMDIFRDLDVVARKNIRSKLIEMSKQGTGIILASTDFSELLTLCNRIITLENDGAPE